ncbi:MAG: glycoside hydrolase family 2 TIM barrel-domain containing protein [Bacteroidota bacterium]
MKNSIKIFFVTLSLLMVFGLLAHVLKNESKPIPKAPQYTDFNKDWNFSLDSTFSKSTSIKVPHVPRVEPLVVNDQWQGTMWYKKEFEYDLGDNEKVFLKFEGVMHESDVWLNEKYLKHHIGGYLPFSIDISDYLKKGKNFLMVKVSNTDNPVIPPGKPLKDLDFNYYGGIYRDVELISKNNVHISDPMLANKIGGGGILIHFSEITNKSAKCQVKIHALNESNEEKELNAEVILKGDDEKTIVQKSNTVFSSTGNDHEFSFSFDVEKPKLWSTTSPHLYSFTTKLYSDGEIVDSVTQKVGIRKIELNSEGFFLNHKKMYIRGTNRHQEYPYVGYAISNEANYRDAVKIKQAGFDFVRLSHYPQDESFLNACDELGLLVMNAIPGWQFYQKGEFEKNSFKDIRDMVRRDRNHPSIVFWETSLNESGMTEEYMIRANEILKEELPFLDTYSAGWIDHASFDLYIPARQHGKPPNYWTDYDKAGRKVFIAEYGDWEYYAQNAGFNQKAFKDLREEERTSRQLREHGEQRLLQQALNFQEAANSNRQGKNTIGDANWIMFDYNRGYADDLEASGISDIFRIPKFVHYFYQSQRPPGESINFRGVHIGGPMVKIASYWDKDSPTEIKVYSNCEEVAFFFNDSLIGKSAPEFDFYSSNLEHPPFIFNVPRYLPGKLLAKGYIDKEEVVRDSVETPGKAKKIKVSADKAGVEIGNFGDGDIVILNAMVLDSDENLVSNDNQSKILFEIESGKAELVGENPSISRAGIASILIKVSGDDRPLYISASNELYGKYTFEVTP